jgi:hypothetical protein
MIDPFYTNQEKPQRPKVTVQDKMDTRDCARLLDYYRMRVGNLKKRNNKKIRFNKIINLLNRKL